MNDSHIGLDLDDTLIHSIFIDDATAKLIETDSKYDYLKGRTKLIKIVDIKDDDIIGNGIISTILVVLRPGVKEFMTFLLSYYDYIFIWTAGSKRYGRAIESILINPSNDAYKKGKIKILTRADCNEITSKTILKDLASKGFDLKRTLIIDDNKTTYVNNPDNAIKISGYDPTMSEAHINHPDEALSEIKSWILENDVKNCKDVRLLNKNTIFKKRAI
jgi:TFIIF-interacting CTD phosphatase-like protein